MGLLVDLGGLPSVAVLVAYAEHGVGILGALRHLEERSVRVGGCPCPSKDVVYLGRAQELTAAGLPRKCAQAPIEVAVRVPGFEDALLLLGASMNPGCIEALSACREIEHF